MNPTYDDGGIRVFHGDARAVLATLDERSIQAVITSPPYWRLRRYDGVDPSAWGGDPSCSHDWQTTRYYTERGASVASGEAFAVAGESNVERLKAARWSEDATCSKCGAWRGQLGMERTINQYVANLVEVFAAVKRVLRDDGICVVNLGDSMVADSKWGGRTGGKHAKGLHDDPDIGRGRVFTGLREKNLAAVPFRFALAMQQDGWVWRSCLPWLKGSAMPESCEDRPSNAVEYVLMFAKNPRYFWNPHAVRRPSGRNYRNSDLFVDTLDAEIAHHRAMLDYYEKLRRGDGILADPDGDPLALLVNPKPLKEDHYAAFNGALIEPFVLAGSATQSCATCGAPWVPIVDRVPNPSKWANDGQDLTNGAAKTGNPQTSRGLHRNGGNAQIAPSAKRATGYVYTAQAYDGRPQSAPRGPKSNFGETAFHVHGFRPACSCGLGGDILPDDFELIASPTGEWAGDDPTLDTGRRGLGRPRGQDEGTRLITRYEQRHYADQLRASPHRDEMAREAGDAFAHYLRTDRSGARPIPPSLLDSWTLRGWLTTVEVPSRDPLPSVPSIVLDPFGGSGTTGIVAKRLGRRAILIDASEKYGAMAARRLAATPTPLPLETTTFTPSATATQLGWSLEDHADVRPS